MYIIYTLRGRIARNVQLRCFNPKANLGVPAPPRKQPNSLLARGGVYVLGMGKNIFKKLCFLFLSDSEHRPAEKRNSRDYRIQKIPAAKSTD